MGVRPKLLIVDLIDVSLGLFVFWTIINNTFINQQELNISNLLEIGALCLFCMSIKYFPLKVIMLWVIVFYGLVEASIAFGQKVGIIESNHHLFNITGTFGNPGQLGGLLAIALIVGVGLFIFYRKSTLVRISLLVVICYIGMALLLTDSRSAWLASGIGSIFYFWRTINWPHRSFYFKLCTILLLTTICIGGYFYKKGSADGRLLIWKISMNMIVERPLVGHGTGSFGQKYMYYQADYFKKNSESALTIYADDISYPFNEFLHLWIEYGIIAVFIGGYLILHISLKKASVIGRIYCVAFIALLIYSLFSYPSYILGLLILFPVLLSGMESKSVFEIKLHLPIYCCVLYGTLFSTFFFFFYTYGECKELNDNIEGLYSFDSAGVEKAKDYFIEHYDLLKTNPRMIELYAGFYSNHPQDRSKIILEDAIKIIPSSDLLCHIGDEYKRNGNMHKSIWAYQLAQNMVPYRIRPRYKQFLLYKELGNFHQAQEVAEETGLIPVKIKGTETLKMKGEMKRFLLQIQDPACPDSTCSVP